MLLIPGHAKKIFFQISESFTLSDPGKKPHCEIVLFFSLPLIFAAGAFFVCSRDKLSEQLLIALSIFMGFLINLLMPFFSFIESQGSQIKRVEMDKLTEEERRIYSLRRARLRQYVILFSQIAFSTLLSLMAVAMLVIVVGGKPLDTMFPVTVFSNQVSIGHILYCCVDFLSIYLSALNFVNLFRILISSNSLIFPFLKDALNSSGP